MMTLWNDGWKFAKMPLFTEYEDVGETDFRPVGLPHDALIYQSSSLYEDFTGWYKKAFFWERREGERVRIRFDGVYMDCSIFVNGQRAGEWKYGYSSFEVEVGHLLAEGENILSLSVCHRSPNSRWYSGAGIYRNVWLKRLPMTCVESDSLYFRTAKSREVEGRWDFFMDAQVLLKGDDTRLFYRLSPKGGENAGPAPQGELQPVPSLSSSCDGDFSHLISCGFPPEFMGKSLYRGRGYIDRPNIWDIENPGLYELELRLYEGERLTHVIRETVGFRSISLSPREGFLLNHRRVPLRGVCEHHDLGCFGAAFSAGALRRRFLLLKSMGVNAIRTAHNMPDPGLMALADEMGFLVVSEAFDMWELSKTPYDYARFFPEWYKRDVASWIRRDRNHPSLIMWSIGNEIYDTHKDEKGYEWCRKLLLEVAAHDPEKNAFTTIGSNYMGGEQAGRCAALVDAAGYNYGERLYESHHRRYPDRVIYGSETGSVVQSRGIYHFPYEASILADEDFQCSALGNSTTSWGAKSAEAAIFSDDRYPFSLGQFIWTGFDYIGEPTPYHTRNSYFGQLDTAGFEKDSYYIYRAAWTSPETSPMVHVFPYMDFNPGQPVDVLAASNGYEVELFLGERSMGRQILKAKEGRRLCGHWHFSYTGEEVHAIAFNEEGKEIARDSRYPFSEGTALRIRPERDFLLADGEDVGFFVIRCFDEQGRAVENANACVQITCDGAAFAVGTDNGDSTDEGEYKSLKRRLFSGKLLFAAKAGTTPGDFRVTVAAPGLREASVVIPVLPAHVREGVAVEAHLVQEAPASPLYREVRAIRLKSKNGTLLTRENPETLVEAFLLPPQARDRRLLWALTDVRGIPAAMASLEEGENSVLVRALSDGEGKIRCMSKSGSDAVRLISELPLKVEGFGSRAKNPFAYIHAGVYDMGEGEIGNGNERGVATSRHGRTCIGFRDIDFGKRGARKFDMDIFALTGDPYEILVYDGMPEEGGKRLGKFVYQKPSIWNTYQGESFILEKPLRGIKTLVFVLFDKVHIRGFRFEKPDKPLLRFEAGECDRIYGDSFRREADAVLSIGNNVTLEFCGIETEGEGTRELLLRGQTPLENNTVHVKIRSAQGEEHHILEFGGGSGLQTFPLLIPAGTYDFLFIFLPGSRFDFYGFALQ